MEFLRELEGELFKRGVDNNIFYLKNNELILNSKENFKYLLLDLKEINKIMIEKNIKDLKDCYLNTDLFCQYEWASYYLLNGYVTIIDKIKFIETNNDLKVCFYFSKRDGDLNYLSEDLTLETLIFDFKNGFCNKSDFLMYKDMDNIESINKVILELIYIKLLKLFCKNNIDITEILCSKMIKYIKKEEDFNNFLKKVIAPNSKIYGLNTSITTKDLTIENIVNQKINLRSINLFTLEKDFILRGYNSDRFYQTLKNNYNNIFAKNSKEILKEFNLKPLKSYADLIKINLDNIFIIKTLNDLNINNKDIKFLIENNFIKNINVDNSILLNLYKNHLKPKEIANKLKVKSADSMINDIDNLLKDLIKYDYDINTLNFKLSLHNFEQELIDIHAKLSYRHFKNVAISYNLEGLDYSYDFFSIYEKENMELLLPLNLAILKEIGAKSKWCINNSSYEKKILSGESIIMFIKEKGYINGCIELNFDFSALVQAKSKRNLDLNKAQISFIESFCLENNICIKTTDMVNDEFREVI